MSAVWRDFLTLLAPDWWQLRSSARSLARGRPWRAVGIALTGAAVSGGVFGVMHRLLGYFHTVPGLGDALAAKLLGLVLLGFSGLMLVSSALAALATFFAARDLDMLAAAPVHGIAVYGARLVETAISAGWVLLAVITPVLAAYGAALGGGVSYAFVAAAVLLPLTITAAALGVAATLLLVSAMPARPTRALMGAIAVLGAAGVVLAVRLLRPERIAQPDGARSLVDFLALLRAPIAPWLPSGWGASALMSRLGREPDATPLALLWLVTAAALALGAGLHHAFHERAMGRIRARGGRVAPRRTFMGHAWTARVLGVRRRELLLRELRVFWRDAAQWSQLALLGALLGVYVLDTRYLPAAGGATFFLTNVVPFLNLAAAALVLAVFAVRSVYPLVSLEGRAWWLLRASPLPMRELLWVKFWAGALPLLVMSLAIVFTTDVLLGVTPFVTAVSVGTIALLALALTALALSFGAVFPKFDAGNAARIAASPGGVAYVASAVALIVAVLVLEARPVYSYLAALTFGMPVAAGDLLPGLAGAGVLCVAATLVPLRVAVARLERTEQ